DSRERCAVGRSRCASRRDKDELKPCVPGFRLAAEHAALRPLSSNCRSRELEFGTALRSLDPGGSTPSSLLPKAYQRKFRARQNNARQAPLPPVLLPTL